VNFFPPILFSPGKIFLRLKLGSIFYANVKNGKNAVVSKKKFGFPVSRFSGFSVFSKVRVFAIPPSPKVGIALFN